MTNYFHQAHEYAFPTDKYFQFSDGANILNSCYSGDMLLYHDQKQQGENRYDFGMLNLLYFQQFSGKYSAFETNFYWMEMMFQVSIQLNHQFLNDSFKNCIINFKGLC